MDIKQTTIIAGILVAVICLMVQAERVNSQVVFPAGQPQGSITNVNGNMSDITSQTTITLTAPATKIQVYSASGASNVYCDFNNVAAAAATGGTTEVFGGGSETYVGAPLKKFKIISDGSTGKYCIVAN